MSDTPDLRSLFQAARQADEASAPAFDKVRHRVPTRDENPGRRGRVLLAAVAAVVGVVGLALILFKPREPDGAASGDATVGRKAVSLSEWEGPTDFLLKTPGQEFLESTPRIGVGVPSFSVVEAQPNRKGNHL